MICNIEDKRASATASRLVEGARVSGWKQAINQMAVAFPDRFDKYLINLAPRTNNLTRSPEVSVKH